MIQDYEDRCLALKADISELESQVEALEGERDSLTENMNESSEEAGALKNAYETILNAAQYYVTGDFVTFADVFPTIDQAMSEDPTYQAMYALMKADYDTNLTTRLYMMAVTYREQNQDRQSAITICDKILSIDPNYDAALFYKALCYEETGDTGTAQTLYLEYLTGFPAGIWTQEVRNRMSAIAPAVLQMFDSGQITAGTVLPGITP